MECYVKDILFFFNVFTMFSVCLMNKYGECDNGMSTLYKKGILKNSAAQEKKQKHTLQVLHSSL